jgi:hypothetical protein
MYIEIRKYKNSNEFQKKNLGIISQNEKQKFFCKCYYPEILLEKLLARKAWFNPPL